MKTRNGVLGRHDNGKLLRQAAVELPMEFTMQDLGKSTWYPHAGPTVVLLFGAEFVMEYSFLPVNKICFLIFEKSIVFVKIIHTNC